jgi:D-alanyl-D-alanine carboxypeptidase
MKTRIIQDEPEPAEPELRDGSEATQREPNSGRLLRLRHELARRLRIAGSHAGDQHHDAPIERRKLMNTRSSNAESRRGRYRNPARWSAILACLAAVVCISATGAMAKPTTAAAASPQTDVDALVAAGATGAILFVRDGNKTTRYTGGLADIATQRPIGAADHYRIASLTKTYVATVVLQLVAEGKLRLSDTVERWLPGLVPKGNQITIRMLLGHTSGLHDHEMDPEVLKPYLGGNLGYYWSPLRLVKIAASRPALFAPGDTKRASYSSTNYLVAGLIVEKVTRRSIGAELTRRIFKPLRLAGTSYPGRNTQLPSPYAHGYFLLGPPPLVDVSAFSPSLSGAAGGIVSTVGDVAVFYRALLSGRLIEPALLKSMKTTMPATGSDLKQRMGLGLERFPTSCGAAWGHSGSFPGYWTYAFSSANGSRQAVVMVNMNPDAVPEPARPLFYKALYNAYCSTA